MTSITKILSNQANATNSTGPRGPEGKRRSSANATTHGLFARVTPVREEERSLFLEFSAKINADLQPQGPTESFYVDHIIDQCWRLRLCLTLETDLFEWYGLYKGVKGGVGVAFAHDATELNCFARLSRYAPLFERRLAKDLAELRILKAHRSQVMDQSQEQVADCQPEGKSENPPATASHASAPAGMTGPQNPSSSHTQPIIGPKPASHRPFGIFSDQVLLADEDSNQFQTYREDLFAEWQPGGATKALFVELFAVTSWRLARLSRVEAGLYEQYRIHDNVDGGILTAFVQDASELDCFAKLSHYETQLRYSLSRMLKELVK